MVDPTKAARCVSVIVPTRDRPALLREALASIRALEGPDLNFEILVGDNGVNPDSARAAAEYDAIYLQTKTNGASAARNLGLQAATGEFVAFLDDDDLWQPGNIRGHIAMMDADPGLSIVFGQVTLTDVERRPITPPFPQSMPPDKDLVRAMLSGWFPQLGATTVRASACKDIGLFDEALIGDQDWDWQIRATRMKAAALIFTPSVLFRDRPKGSYDDLQRKRIAFTRKVFLRHAFAERSHWRSAASWMRSYFLCFQYFYAYFANAAEERAAAGQRLSALYAAATAFWLYPTRALSHLRQPTPLRAAMAYLAGVRRIAAAHTPRV